MIDGVEAFHAGYLQGRVTAPPQEYIDLVLVPSILHTPTADFWALPWFMQHKIRGLLMRYISSGWAGNMQLVKRDMNAG